MATAGDARGAGPERAFAPQLPVTGEVLLDAEESAHLVRVRRVAVGSEVALFDGRGVTRRARLLTADPRAARLLVWGEGADRAPRRALTVAASIPEPARADALVEALAWLGVTRWVPLLCSRTPANRAALVDRRAERWARIAREAAKGNGRSLLLEVGAATRLDELLAAPPAAGLVLLDPDPEAGRLLDLLCGREALPWLLVGPEGGFTQAEVEAARGSGVPTASLGATALRVEIAAQAAAAQSLGLS